MTLRERIVPLLLGIAAVVLATAAGHDPRLLQLLVSPPALVRGALVGGMVVLGLWLLRQALERIARSGSPGGPVAGVDVAVMLRGIRLVFLGLASFAAAGGWLLGHPLPLILAAVIAGIDVIETSFLLLVLAARRTVEER
jgi:hypothetical protein